MITDPFAPEDGKKLPRNFSADIVTSSHAHPRHNNISAVAGDPFVVDGPGEFEVKEVFITGVSTYHDKVEGKEKGQNTIFYITAEDLHMAHLGDLRHPLDSKHMEDVHSVDILFVPVGGGSSLTAKEASDVVGQLEPRIIIPIHYRSGKVGSKLDKVDGFLKAMGASNPEVLPKLKISKKDLPQDEMRIVILEPQ